MNTQHLRLLLPLALAACAVKVNGKSYGPGNSGNSGDIASSGSTASGGSSGGGGRSESAAAPTYAAASSQCYQMGSDGDHPPILSTPADPWLGVSSEQPVELDRAFKLWQPGDCSAQHDHCLRDCVWFAGDPATDKEPSITGPSVHTGDGYLRGVFGSHIEKDTLYRTVPATKRMLTRGAIVVAVGDMLATPTAETDKWHIGELDRVDWKAGTIYMVGSANPYMLSSTRVAVLAWKDKGKVEILGGRKRDELAVRDDELFAPRELTASNDPWSQVKDGQPIVVADRQPFAEVEGVCKPQNDHCLRPWVWIVDTNNGYAYVAKFDGKAFQGLKAIDDLSRIDNIMAAYRTVPATTANLKVGAQVFWGAGSEKSAHTLRWDTGKVKKIRDDGKVDVERTSSNDTVKLDRLRVPVVVWYPGEKAEAL